MTLDAEWETYQRELPNLLDREGKHVLIHGDSIAGVFDSFDEALREGYERVGLYEPFFVKQIRADEKPQFFSRNVRPCPT